MKTYSIASTNLREALVLLKVSLPEYDVRRLINVTRHCLSGADAAKYLRKIISQYRIDHVKVLAIRGVGKKTFESVHALYAEIEALENLKDTSIRGSIQSARNSLANIRRRCPTDLHPSIDKAIETLVSFNVHFTNHLLAKEQGR